MRKIVKSMAISMLLVLTLAASAFANPVNDIRSELIAIGVPTNYVANIVEYLQKTTITDAQYNKVMSYIEEGKAVIGDVEDLTQLSSADKNKVQNLVTNAASVVGLKAEFGKDSNGENTLIVTNSNGGTLLQLSAAELTNMVENFDTETIAAVIEDMVEFSNDTHKGEYNPTTGELTDQSTEENKPVDGDNKPGTGVYEPVEGELNQTSVNYGNVMVSGAALVACAIGVFVYSRRAFA